MDMSQDRDADGQLGRPPFRSRTEIRELLERAMRGERRTAGRGDLAAALRRAGVTHPFGDGPLWLHEFAFSATVGEVPEARRRVAEFAADCGLDGSPLYDMTLAAAEALSNAVRHGSPQGFADEVRVRVGIVDHPVLVEVRDRGPGFDCSRTCLPASREVGGRGIPFMRGLLDDLRFDCATSGTSVLLVKRTG